MRAAIGGVKNALKRIPVVAPLVRRALGIYRKATFPGSSTYWKDRYAEGGNSGRGSYGAFAEFKAEVINGLIRELGIGSTIEFGCGDGAQLAQGAYGRYIGLDVSPEAIRACARRFAGDTTKSFFLYDPTCFIDHHGLFRAELALSLDVIYHLTEDAVFEAYMRHLFASGSRYVVIYSNDSAEYSPAPHIKYRRFSDWIGVHAAEWVLWRRIPNRFPHTGDDRTGSPSDFFVYSCEKQL